MEDVNLWDSGYDAGLAMGHDDVIRLADFIQDVLADQREAYVDEDFVVVHVIDHISAILDSYMDDYKEDWNAH